MSLAVAACCLDERAEERRAGPLRILLGVPQHAETERLLGILDGLDLTVGRSSRDDEPLPHPPDALVVGRVHARRSSRGARPSESPPRSSTGCRPNTPAAGGAA